MNDFFLVVNEKNTITMMFKKFWEIEKPPEKKCFFKWDIFWKNLQNSGFPDFK